MVLKNVEIALDPATNTNRDMIRRKILNLQAFITSADFDLWDFIGQEPKQVAHGAGGYALCVQQTSEQARIQITITSKTGLCSIGIVLEKYDWVGGWREPLIKALSVAHDESRPPKPIRLFSCEWFKTR